MQIEPLHFSTLKALARSPAHFKTAIEEPRKPTDEMDLGALVHRLVLGPRPGDGELAVWTGGRRAGKEWDKFCEEHKADVIVRAVDFHTAKRIATAVQADHTAAELLDGASFEVRLTWDEGGVRCETRGVDIIKPLADGSIAVAELKTTTNTEPSKWQRQCFTMLYPQQLELYRAALEQNGRRVSRVAIIGVEVTPPHAVTVLELTPALLEFARKSIVKWIEQLRVCIADDHWPNYSQCPVTFDLPPWLAGPAGGDDEGEEAA